MILKNLLSLFVVLSFSSVLSLAQPAVLHEVYSLNPQLLQYAKELLKKGDPLFQSPFTELIKKADHALTLGPFTVVTKEKLPPSGDKHDYMSMGPYWWPNPNTQNGLPYIRKDGERNPELKKFEDRENIAQLIGSVKSLSLAYFFSDNEKYAEHAVHLLKTWFINPDTRMNPNLNFGQSIPGITDGRAEGLIETVGLIDVVDGIGILKNSKSLSDSDLISLRKWFANYLTWITESRVGKDEIAAENNHGTWCDAQSIAYAMFSQQPEVAMNIIETRSYPRINLQILENGSQPRELARTLSWDYSNMNLRAFFTLANLAKNIDVDLMNYKSRGFVPLRQALDFLVPYLKEEKKWENKQIKPMEYDNTCFSLRMGTLYYHDPVYEALIRKYDQSNASDLTYLLWPIVH
jgi:hypothetical protein